MHGRSVVPFLYKNNNYHNNSYSAYFVSDTAASTLHTLILNVHNNPMCSNVIILILQMRKQKLRRLSNLPKMKWMAFSFLLLIFSHPLYQEAEGGGLTMYWLSRKYVKRPQELRHFYTLNSLVQLLLSYTLWPVNPISIPSPNTIIIGIKVAFAKKKSNVLIGNKSSCKVYI